MDCSTTRNRNKHQGPLPPGNCLSCEKVLIVMLRIHVFCCLLSLLNSLNHKIIEKIRLWRISKGLEEGLASYLGEIDQGFICLSFEYLLGQSFQKFSGQIALVFNQTPSFWTFFFFFLISSVVISFVTVCVHSFLLYQEKVHFCTPMRRLWHSFAYNYLLLLLLLLAKGNNKSLLAFRGPLCCLSSSLNTQSPSSQGKCLSPHQPGVHWLTCSSLLMSCSCLAAQNWTQ